MFSYFNQGSIQGTDELAEGLARGVQSLMGNTVGGTAGAISLVTGSIGNAFAALSFDADYQKVSGSLIFFELK